MSQMSKTGQAARHGRPGRGGVFLNSTTWPNPRARENDAKGTRPPRGERGKLKQPGGLDLQEREAKPRLWGPLGRAGLTAGLCCIQPEGILLN